MAEIYGWPSAYRPYLTMRNTDYRSLGTCPSYLERQIPKYPFEAGHKSSVSTKRCAESITLLPLILVDWMMRTMFTISVVLKRSSLFYRCRRLNRLSGYATIQNPESRSFSWSSAKDSFPRRKIPPPNSYWRTAVRYAAHKTAKTPFYKLIYH